MALAATTVEWSSFLHSLNSTVYVLVLQDVIKMKRLI